MDSALVYRGMDIGTAKPEPEVLAAIPHHLIDILDPTEVYSAGRFALDAARCIEDIHARGKQALIVGGTMLYLRALRDGLAPLPKRDPGVRAALDAEAERLGWPALHARLAEIDPDSAQRIAAQDRQRIQRALEVHALTGRPLSALQREPARAPLDILTLALVPEDRLALARRIEQRFDAMVKAGFVDEVRRLRARADLTADGPAMRSVGYRQIWAHLDGRFDWNEARRRAIAATRQLAKRQMTWLRTDARAEILRPGAADLLARVLERARGGRA